MPAPVSTVTPSSAAAIHFRTRSICSVMPPRVATRPSCRPVIYPAPGPAAGRMGGMDLGLRDRVYLVTGGTRGLGFATARALVDDGARVVVSGRDEKRAAEAVAAL